jgi:hypothetical protein
MPLASSLLTLETPFTMVRYGLCRRPNGGHGGGCGAIGDPIVAAATGVFQLQSYTILLGREQGGVAVQEKDLFDVAAARLQGHAPSRRSSLELLWPGIATSLRRGTGAMVASEP